MGDDLIKRVQIAVDFQRAEIGDDVLGRRPCPGDPMLTLAMRMLRVMEGAEPLVPIYGERFEWE